MKFINYDDDDENENEDDRWPSSFELNLSQNSFQNDKKRKNTRTQKFQLFQLKKIMQKK